MLVAIICAIASTVFNVVGPKVLGQATTELYAGVVAQVQGTGGIDLERIGTILLTLLAIYLASTAMGFLQGWIMASVTQKVTYGLRAQVAEKIARIELSYFDSEKHSKGDVLSRITNDVDTLGTSLNQSVTQLITSAAQLVGVLVMMITISLPLTGITLLTLPVSLGVVGVVVSRSQKWFKAQQSTLGKVNGIVEEDFAGQEVIQVFDRANASVDEFDESNGALYESAWKSQFLSGLMTLGRALREVHFPSTLASAEQARRRLAYDELVCLQLALFTRRNIELNGVEPTSHVINGPHVEALCASLPFSLTDEQRIASSQILADMETPFVVLCRPGCKGLCPVCGANLNEGDCGHAAQVERDRLATNPFAVLRDLDLGDADDEVGNGSKDGDE